ncbi:MAG: ammonium transporter [Blastochloris sp.]|nr:ammonium transporter [Blastochloris sp.]
MSNWIKKFVVALAVGAMTCTLLDSPAMAQEAAPVAAEAAVAAEAPAGPSAEMFTVNNTWMMVAAALVFFMNLGFACVETGMTRSKNTVNILFKNSLIPCLGILTYAWCGFNLMYPGFDYDAGANGWFGFAGWGITTNAEGITSAYNAGYTYWTDFLFQAMFAATAVTIVSGAVAERIKLSSFMIFAFIYVAFIYPIAGSWKWGNGWLNNLEVPFYDFAGSTLVHSVGGWGALAGALILGPRLGKYVDGKIKPILGHSMPLATIGVFILWLGWFGFNGGSVLSADPGLVSVTLVMTCIAAAAGGVSAALISWIILKKPDLTMALNGILAGLVGITAGADQMTAMESTVIGLVAGALVFSSVLLFDKIKIDDPVGAISVHLVCGIWGTLAVGLIGAKAGIPQLISQFTGVLAYGVFCFVSALVIFLVLKVTMGLRVSAEEEIGGLDIGEHGQEAYPDFSPVSKV